MLLSHTQPSRDRKGECKKNENAVPKPELGAEAEAEAKAKAEGSSSKEKSVSVPNLQKERGRQDRRQTRQDICESRGTSERQRAPGIVAGGKGEGNEKGKGVNDGKDGMKERCQNATHQTQRDEKEKKGEVIKDDKYWEDGVRRVLWSMVIDGH